MSKLVLEEKLILDEVERNPRSHIRSQRQDVYRLDRRRRHQRPVERGHLNFNETLRSRVSIVIGALILSALGTNSYIRGHAGETAGKGLATIEQVFSGHDQAQGHQSQLDSINALERK